ncbi:MAG: glycerol kinase GlpK [Flavobacteriaceae bacterium]|nr:glycerol kinase GlpK [Flavobacteriaceae bacterium]
MKYIIAIDAGTTSSRAILFDKKGHQIGVAQNEFTQFFPQNGWVEHDANEIWESQKKAIHDLTKQTGVQDEEIAAIGITNQRETTIIWNKETGEPVGNAIVWQDRRTASICAELKQKHEATFTAKTGLLLDPYFSGTKIKWILDQDPKLKKQATEGKLAFGTVDSWLIWNLTDGNTHVTDVTNASRTLLFNIHTLDWDDELLDILDIPKAILPKVVSCSEVVGETSVKSIGKKLTISGIAGDQQAALFGQLCWESGDVKNTYGTGCFCIMNTGSKAIVSKNKMLTTIGYQIGGKTTYAIEGSVFIAGALIQWLRDELNMVTESSQIEALAKTVSDNGGITFLPSLTGLGAPYWEPNATGGILGITRGTKKGHIARAALEAIALRSYELVNAMQKDANTNFSVLKVDGGASQNNLLLQIQANVLNTKVVRPEITETTALGAAFFAGLAVGFWKSQEEIQTVWKENAQFHPDQDKTYTNQMISLWNQRIQVVLNKDG